MPDLTVQERDGPDLALPPVEQPRGLRYYFGTWSGRLIVVNTIVFVAMSVASHSVFLPTSDVLLLFGAKDPVGLAHWEFWRFFAPTFVHIGIIHFFFNTLGLYYIGYQLERILGSAWFLAIYLLSGTCGNVASSVFTVAISAGASGALFGLLGCGFYLERAIGGHIEKMTGQRPRRSIYGGMVVINVILGLAVPGIDNAAHLGGLLTGVLMTFVMVNLRPNRLRHQSKIIGWGTFSVYMLLTMTAAGVGMSTAFQGYRLAHAGMKYGATREGYHYLSQAIELEPRNLEYRIERARILLVDGDYTDAFDDVREAAKDTKMMPALEKLVQDLEKKGLMTQAWQLKRFLEHNQPAAQSSQAPTNGMARPTESPSRGP